MCPTPVKTAYPNQVQAWREFRRITTRAQRRRERRRLVGDDIQGRLGVYRCQAGHWHLGHIGGMNG